jgi:hypothetical protein
VEKDNRDIRRDTRIIQRHKAEGATRSNSTTRDERNAALSQRERAMEHGQFHPAEKWDARRRQEQKEINWIKVFTKVM